jgi:hypothetical protein
LRYIRNLQRGLYLYCWPGYFPPVRSARIFSYLYLGPGREAGPRIALKTNILAFPKVVSVFLNAAKAVGNYLKNRKICRIE